MDKKTFALNAIKPYYKDPSLCGVVNGACTNVTNDGKKCVAGKYMIDPSKEEGDIGEVLYEKSQSDVFVVEAVNILTTEEWYLLQSIHDAIAKNNQITLTRDVTNLNLFTMEELQA